MVMPGVSWLEGVNLDGDGGWLTGGEVEEGLNQPMEG